MLRTLGHMFLSAVFIAGGADAFAKPGGRVNAVAKANLPNPHQAVVLNGAGMVLGGTMLAFGITPKLAASLLLGFLVPTTLVGHPFWKEETEAGRKMQLTQFLKNLGLIGGLILVLREKHS